VAPLHDLMTRRLTLGLRIAGARGGNGLGPLLETQSALRDLFPEVSRLLENFRSASLLLQSIGGNEEHEGLIQQLQAVQGQLLRGLRSLRPRLQAWTYPFEHASGKVDLAEMLIGRLPADDDFGATLRAVEGLGDKYYTLYARVLGLLVHAAEKVEAAPDVKTA
jgi:hypothetical protein